MPCHICGRAEPLNGSEIGRSPDMGCHDGVWMDVDEYTEGWERDVIYPPCRHNPAACSACAGTGDIPDEDECPACDGTGWVGEPQWPTAAAQGGGVTMGRYSIACGVGSDLAVTDTEKGIGSQAVILRLPYDEAARRLLAEPQMRDALEKIADETKTYLGHGDYEIVPAYSAEEAQSIARTALAVSPPPASVPAPTVDGEAIRRKALEEAISLLSRLIPSGKPVSKFEQLVDEVRRNDIKAIRSLIVSPKGEETTPDRASSTPQAEG